MKFTHIRHFAYPAQSFTFGNFFQIRLRIYSCNPEKKRDTDVHPLGKSPISKEGRVIAQRSPAEGSREPLSGTRGRRETAAQSPLPIVHARFDEIAD